MWKENEKKPILQFVLITFGISWGAEFLVLLLEQLNFLPDVAMKVVAMALISVGAALAPGFAVYRLLKKYHKISGIKDYLKRVFACENKKRFWVGIGFAFVYFAVYVVCTEPKVEGIPIFLAPFMLLLMIPGGGWEELGWRGFLQPALEEKIGFVPGTFLMGVIWSVWHLPLWLIQSANQKEFLFWAFALYCIAFSFLLAITYHTTKSVFAAILLHAWGNTMCGGLFYYGILAEGPDLVSGMFLVGMIVLSTVIYYAMRPKRW